MRNDMYNFVVMDGEDSNAEPIGYGNSIDECTEVCKKFVKENDEDCIPDSIDIYQRVKTIRLTKTIVIEDITEA